MKVPCRNITSSQARSPRQKNEFETRAGGVAAIECLPRMHEALGSILREERKEEEREGERIT